MLIGTDRNIFTTGSTVRRRVALLAATHFDVIDSIVFSARSHQISQGVEEGNFHAHPTNSRLRILYGWDAFQIAKHLTRPDVVSAQDPFETGLAALFISRMYGVPLAVEVHTDFLAPSYRKHSVLNMLRVLIAGYVLKRAGGGYAVSQNIRDKIVQHYNLKVPFSVLPIYIDVSRFEALVQREHSTEKVLLWIGRMELEKNPERALDAFIVAREKGIKAKVVFAGAGSLREKLETKARTAGVIESVEFVGHVADPLPYYAQADLVLVTSDYEGYGMVIVEALAAHVPVLSTDVGVAREAGAEIVVGDFATALETWLSGKPKAGTLQLRSYANEEDYLSQVANCYKDIVYNSTHHS